MTNITRRNAVKLLGTGAFATLADPLSLLSDSSPKKKHYLTLSFDDGFKESSLQTASIFEKHNLPACINVIATAHEPGFVLPNEYHQWPVGDFALWNELQKRGHEVMMHGYSHKNKRDLPFEESRKLILQCIDYFAKHLDGFEAKKSVFNFPHNASTPELEEWLPTQVMAFRTGGPAINKLPHKGQSFLTCTTHGPDNIEDHLDQEIENLLKQQSGWLIYNTHGLDDEGWGPMRAEYLDALLGRLTKIKTVEIIPAGKALAAVQ
ncbi:polysaccharide deacetylase family protein [Flavihumibacter solisilvae]|uniref:NodB homology domain-containing protein n=1 Tax=Flavihumibacter solisilvae TaxID=1349421 RepID=A0A0C1IUZ8_9BACT|nr:polysaccharide deacetylase family protein [Flavihumibacter solisilvae]KIC94334.1 hypothetical protein OI18_11960 [Flavihumibacter solisilvae]